MASKMRHPLGARGRELDVTGEAPGLQLTGKIDPAQRPAQRRRWHGLTRGTDRASGLLAGLTRPTIERLTPTGGDLVASSGGIPRGPVHPTRVLSGSLS